MILHIPHSRTKVPKSAKYTVSRDFLAKEIVKITDWYVEDLFEYTPASSTLVFPYSRVYCDVERFENDPLSSIGQGIFYIYDLDGNEIRKHDNGQYEEVLSHYRWFHLQLASLCSQWLAYFSPVIIIDCHSFSDLQALAYGYDEPYPDICIGTDENHTPKDLAKTLKKYFEMNNLTSEINLPYSGSITYLSHFKRWLSVRY